MKIRACFKEKLRNIFYITLGLSMTGISLGSAGNKEMVEEAIQELDAVNKQAVKQLPELPQSGMVDIKAGVTYQDGSPVFDIYEEHIVPSKTEEIHLDQGYSIPSEPQKRTQP